MTALEALNAAEKRMKLLAAQRSGQWKPTPIVDGCPTCAKCGTVLRTPGDPCPGCGISCREACGFIAKTAEEVQDAK